MFDYQKILRYMFYCHQLPERSFFFRGRQFPICACCTGILICYIIGFIYILIFKELHIFFEFLLMIPLLIDGTGQYLVYFQSTNIRRLLAGISTICLFRLACVLGFQSGHWFYNNIITK